MSIEIEPSELGFRRPFNHEVCQILRLRNPNQEALVFKVKTTAPKHYCVRPNSGRVEPGKQVDVQVLLQAMKEDPAPDAKCKDKFLVQAVSVTHDMEFANVTSIFEKSPKAAVVERKIRVNWLPEESSPVSEIKGQSDSFVEEELPAYNSPGGNFETPAPGVAKKNAGDQTSPIPPPHFTDKPVKSESSPSPIEPASALSDAKIAASATPPTDDQNARIASQLASANAQIQRLKELLADEALRQRKTRTGADAATATLQQTHTQGESGVPLQIVAGLCLLSFLIAYFFF